MSFILKMAWRDSRASRRRLVLFSFSVVLGIAALVAIGSLGANLERAIDDQAKGLLGADLVLSGRAPLSDAAQRQVAAVGGERAAEISFSSMMSFPAAKDLTRLVNVRAVEGRFPFYGDFVTVPADAPARLRAGGNVVIVEETLLRQFDTPVGGTVRLGATTFTVVGALQKYPGESSALSATIAPRALIPQAALAATGLAERNVLIRHRTMLRLPAGTEPWLVERELRAALRGEGVGFETVAERRRNLGRALENVENFLGLVGFIALFLGAIGVASAIHVYVRQKIATVAVLRCLGASARQSFAVYLVQGLAIGLIGAALGALLGLGVAFAMPRLLADVLPFQVDFFVSWPAVARGMGAGLVISLLFTLLPLLAVRRVSPLVALRSAAADEGSGRDPWRIAIGVFIAVAVAGFAIWQTGKVRDGLGFAAVLAAGFGILALVAKFTAWAARRWLPRGWPYVVRQGIANLHRPNNRTVLLLLSLGLGTFLILTLLLTRSTLLKEIEFSGGGGRPNLLLFDIQDDQVEGLVQTLTAAGAPLLVQAPIVTMKIATVKGRPVEELIRRTRAAGEGRDAEKGRRGDTVKETDAKKGPAGDRLPGWTLRREYRSTYRAALTNTERLVSGKFTGEVAPGEAVIPISIEEGLFKEMGLALGDEMEWDVQGVLLRTRIGSVRAVEWRRLEPNFFVVFPLGVLEPAPKFHVAAVRADDSAHSARVQRAVVAAYPNVTAIDLALVLETVDGIFSKVALVIGLMSAFTVVTGLIVLAGAVLTGRFQRLRETVLLRTLGATRRQLLQIQVVEYAILGALAAVVGGGLALAGNALLAHFVFRITPAVPGLLLAASIVAVSLVTVLTGLLTSRGVTNHPPLEVLRQET
ncbi:MAG: ABC transporter permease [Opitutaceae bacterium]|nr:ABC transporter permease [Opitutaceae bacterium]